MVNKVILIGNLGADPEVRALESGIKMARVKVATNERIYNSATGEFREHTEWHNILLWRGQADFAEQYLRKGSQVYVEGKIRSSEWTEEATGVKRYAIEILAEEIRLLGGSAAWRNKNDSQSRVGDILTENSPQQSSSPQEQTRTCAPKAPKDADDLPF